MKFQTSYLIPIGGLSIGRHTYVYHLDDELLTHLDLESVDGVDIDVQVVVDVQANLFALHFALSGTVRCPCDRCLAEIGLPVSSAYDLFLSVKEEVNIPPSSDEIIFIEPQTKQYSIESVLHDLVLLSIPMQKMYDCEGIEPLPCDTEVLARMSQRGDDHEGGQSIWDLMNIELN